MKLEEAVKQPTPNHYWLITKEMSPVFRMGIQTVPTGGRMPSEPHKHTDESGWYILKGHARVTAGNETGEVGPGDAVFISSGEEHMLENIGTEQVVYIGVHVRRLDRE